MPTMRYRPALGRAAIDDLRRRLGATRWPDPAPGPPWSLGADVDELRDLVTYWQDAFDFDAHQALLDDLPSHRVEVEGLPVHVLHARAQDEDALPLLLLHGWPDSAWRYRQVYRRLAEPPATGTSDAPAFHVVVPDMPGFGFTPAAPDLLDARAVAGVWAGLMTALGYPRFAVAGGDVGSHVARYLALDHPERVVAVHRMDAGLPRFTGDPAELSAEEREWMAECAGWAAEEGAYAAMHRTKPQTAGVGLNDSPAGLAAWVVEKLRSWSDCGGDLWSAYSREDVLALLTEHWVTGTITSSMRMYHANAAIPAEQLARRVEVPSGFSLFAGDIARPPRAWLERTTRLTYLGTPARGGHFAPYEQPDLYADEIRTFLAPYR